jgi:hypothetical protein
MSQLRLVEVQSCFVRVKFYGYLIYCSLFRTVYRHYYRLTVNEKAIYSLVTLIPYIVSCFDRIFMFSSNRPRDYYGIVLYVGFSGQLDSLEKGHCV